MKEAENLPWIYSVVGKRNRLPILEETYIFFHHLSQESEWEFESESLGPSRQVLGSQHTCPDQPQDQTQMEGVSHTAIKGINSVTQ